MRIQVSMRRDCPNRTAAVSAAPRRHALGLLLGVTLLGIAAAAPAADAPVGIPAGEDFGAGLTLGAVTDLGEVIAHPDRYTGEPVLVRGRISDVCQKKGCWTVLSQGEANVRVDFKDYGFFLPTDCSGEVAYVEGVVKVQRVTRRRAAHLAGESKHPDAEQIHAPGEQVGFTATGVRLIRKD